jgi:hypothetical protein
MKMDSFCKKNVKWFEGMQVGFASTSRTVAAAVAPKS